MRLRTALERSALCAAVGFVLAAGAPAWGEGLERDLSGSFRLESRWFPESAAHSGQRTLASGFVAEPTVFLEDEEGRSFTLTPFLRYDSADSRRTHADLHEAYLLLFGDLGEGEWEARLGFDRVFWGVTELNHLVDIVNQTDLVEHPNEEAKLGQLMAHLTWFGDWGAAELFALPGHRERTFAGRHGRLRSGLVVDDDLVGYESGAEERHLDVAARYSHSFGPLDLGVSVFDGTSREPSLRPASFRPVLDANGNQVLDNEGAPILTPRSLAPWYPQIRQVGLDAQLTVESWLFKFEGIHRTGAFNAPNRRHPVGEKEDHAALAIGGEYTFYSVFESAADLGLLGEWSYDGRGRRSTDKFQDDVFLAARLALNDPESTEFVAGLVVDRDYSTRTLTVEWNRRLSDRWSVRAEAVAFLAADEADPVHVSRRDSFIALDFVYSY
ncbi:MAG: hypothetical protein OXC01_18030 [Immundisolibacterales bacterium]|nr:hypothetical protein [Immundisolibacterales bacterium]